MSCQRVRENIKALVDGELGPVTRFLTARHIAHCEDCRREMAEMADLTARVKSAGDIPVPDGLRSKVLGRLDLRPRGERTRKWWPYKTRPAAVAGVLVATVVMAAVMTPVFQRARRSVKETTASTLPGPVMARASEPSVMHRHKSMTMSPGDTTDDAVGLRGDATVFALPSPPPLPGLLIIKTADISLRVARFQDAYDQAVVIAKSTGGFVTDSSAETTGNVPTSGQVTMKVPVDAFEKTVNRLSALGKVLSKNISGEDVSSEAVDLESRIRNKRAEERQYLEIMNRAKRVPDIITVSNELYRVRGEIEEATGRLKYLKSAAAMSTINLSIAEKAKPRPVASGLHKTLNDALGSLIGTGHALASLAIWLAVYSPIWALPIAAWLYAKKRESRAQRAEG